MVSVEQGTVIVLIALMKSNGLEYVFAAVALAGVIQILIGLFKLGKFIRLVPQPVMFGFVNGLAIIIFMSQLEQFKTVVNGESVWLSGSPMFVMLGLVALTYCNQSFFPK
jgi:SulP family sulfate permease